MKKELIIYTGIFLFLAIGMHFKQWMSHPVEHLMNMSAGGAFGVPGAIHPFVFAFVVYALVGVFRLIGKLFSRSK